MAVRSMIQVVSEEMEACLSERVPEDVDAVYDVATVLMPDMCSDGHFHGMKPMVRMGLYVDFSDEKVHRSPVNTSVIIPAWYVQDGDTDPVREAVDHLWNDACFANMMEPLAPMLNKAAAMEGGEDFLVDDDEEVEVDDEEE